MTPAHRKSHKKVTVALQPSIKTPLPLSSTVNLNRPTSTTNSSNFIRRGFLSVCKMRPDTRSFSFTWLKGQQKEDEDRAARPEKPAEEEGGWGAKRGNSGSRLRRLSNSLARLRGGRYTSMEEAVEDENWTKISEEPMNLEEDSDEEEDIPPRRFEHEEMKIKASEKQPDVVQEATNKVSVEPAVVQAPVPFRTQNGSETGDGASTSGGMSLGKRLNKTVQDVKASLGNFSQKFRKSTRRRYRMGPGTPGSLASPTKRILGRTPTKLYSPFGIDSPALRKTPKRLADRPSTPRLARKSMVAAMVYSPSNNFRRDLDEARRGMEDFHMITRDITRRSVRF